MVYVFLANGFEEIEALCTVDILRRAKIDVQTVGVGGKTITGSHKITVIADTTEEELSNTAPFEMIVLPGGLPGADNLDASYKVDLFISRAISEDKYIAAICAAPYILGKRDILKGKRACCYPGFEINLKGAWVEERGVIRDGKIITARAMGYSHDFALELVEALSGKAERAKIAEGILYKA